MNDITYLEFSFEEGEIGPARSLYTNAKGYIVFSLAS